MDIFRKGDNMSPRLEEPVKKSISSDRKERLKSFIHGFKNKSKVDTFKMSNEVRGKR